MHFCVASDSELVQPSWLVIYVCTSEVPAVILQHRLKFETDILNPDIYVKYISEDQVNPKILLLKILMNRSFHTPTGK